MDYIDLNLSGKTESPPSERAIDLQASFLAAAALIALMAIGRFIFHLPLLPEIIADWAFAIMPASFTEDIITMFGAFAKRLGFIGCSIAYLTFLTTAGTAYLGWIDRKRLGENISSIVYGISLWLVTVCALLPLFGGGLFGRNLWSGALLSSTSLLVYHLAYGLAAVRLRSAFAAKADLAQTGGRLLNRRTALRAVMVAIVGAAAYDIFKPILETWRNATAGKVTKGTGVFPDNERTRETTALVERPDPIGRKRIGQGCRPNSASRSIGECAYVAGDGVQECHDVSAERTRIVMGELSTVCGADLGIGEGIEQDGQRFRSFDHGVMSQKQGELLTLAEPVYSLLARPSMVERARIDALEFESKAGRHHITAVR